MTGKIPQLKVATKRYSTRVEKCFGDFGWILTIINHKKMFFIGDGLFLGERGNVFNNFNQISGRGVGRFGLAKTAKPFCPKFD